MHRFEIQHNFCQICPLNLRSCFTWHKLVVDFSIIQENMSRHIETYSYRNNYSSILLHILFFRHHCKTVPAYYESPLQNSLDCELNLWHFCKMYNTLFLYVFAYSLCVNLEYAWSSFEKILPPEQITLFNNSDNLTIFCRHYRKSSVV